MKKINLILLAMIFFANAYSQTAYNPFTQNIHFNPEPTIAGFPCGSVQTVAFTQGLTTAADATDWANNPLTVTICITGFTFNGPASSIVSGSYASNFNWTFDPFSPTCLVGTQNQTLIGTGSNPLSPNPLSSGEIKVSLLVPETSPINTVLAVNVNLQVPGYMQAFNSQPDDNESTQTQTYCSLKISGTVFNDTDSSNNDVNGTPIASAGGATLYANLIGSNGTVVASQPISSNGNYEFLNLTPNTDYFVILSINQGVIGNPAPSADLPPLWVNTGEDCCDMIGNDGNANGINASSLTNSSKINVNFGIKNPSLTGTPLPVVLKNFFVNGYKCNALLSWTTSQEDNASHVEIFRKDGPLESFKKIATVKSAGLSSSDKLYSYLDKTVIQNSAYEYQLRFVDIDNKFTLSDIKTLTLKCDISNSSVNIFPNPASSDLNVLFVTDKQETVLDLEITDITGRTILTKKQIMQNGSNVVTFDISSFANASYFLRYSSIDGLTNGSLKFIKQ